MAAVPPLARLAQGRCVRTVHAWRLPASPLHLPPRTHTVCPVGVNLLILLGITVGARIAAFAGIWSMWKLKRL